MALTDEALAEAPEAAELRMAEADEPPITMADEAEVKEAPAPVDVPSAMEEAL